jgi:hypothetical protein
MNRLYGASVRLLLTAASLAAVLCLSPAVRGQAMMPAAQQNAVVQKYCGSCHSDALMYGGLSVEHFDAAHADPTVAAMLVSKLTNGHTPRDVKAAAQSSDGDAAILRMMRASAMGAAGNGVPDDTTQAAFAKALSAEAAGAEEWNSSEAESGHILTAAVVTAAIIREHPSAKRAGVTDMYRLILTCRSATHEGEIKLAWANGVPDEGRQITIAVDGKTPFTHIADGGKKQGNGTFGPGATVLYPSAAGKLPLPAHSLSVANVFGDETVVFPFDNLNPTVRRDLSACFIGADKTY